MYSSSYPAKHTSSQSQRGTSNSRAVVSKQRCKAWLQEQQSAGNGTSTEQSIPTIQAMKKNEKNKNEKRHQTQIFRTVILILTFPAIADTPCDFKHSVQNPRRENLLPISKRKVGSFPSLWERLAIRAWPYEGKSRGTCSTRLLTR